MKAIHLNHKILGNGKPLVILHGLFGSLDNWQTHAKTLSEYFQVVMVDVRNHGHSEHTDAHSYDHIAEDLRLLLETLGLPNAHFLGHSMGGKAVMRFAQLYPERIDKLIVADMGIKAYPPHHDTIIQGLQAVAEAKPNSRKIADDVLSRYVKDNGVKQFLLKNLYWKEPGALLDWRMNLKTLVNEMPKVLMALPNQPKCHLPTLFIRGGMSNYILDSDINEIETLFSEANITTIDEVGHWLHAEKPQEFMDIVLQFLLF
jgi:pimeloyl-ACP methyl ester carboxylesterase